MTATYLSPEHANQIVPMTRLGKTIRKLHDQVCSEKRRVEITRPGCDDVCVMISKKELDGLEQALEIFADTEAFIEMSENLKSVLAMANEIYAAPAGSDNDP